MSTPSTTAAEFFTRYRPLLRGVLLFAVMLGIGRFCEVVFDKKTLERAVQGQEWWMSAVERLSPFGLARGYMSDLDRASHGDIIFRRVDTAAIAALDSAAKVASEQRSRCSIALGVDDSEAIRDRCTSLGVNDVLALADLDRDAKREYAEARAKFNLGDTGLGIERPVPAFLVPILAFVRLVTRYFTSGFGSTVIALLQLAMGWLGLLLFRRIFSRRDANAGPTPASILLFPISVIAMASALAWALHVFMFGAFHALHWVTALAAAAAGASGLMGFCWYCVTKLSERGLESAVIPNPDTTPQKLA